MAAALPYAIAHAAKYPFPVVVNGALNVRKLAPTKAHINRSKFTPFPNLGWIGIDDNERSSVMTGIDMT